MTTHDGGRRRGGTTGAVDGIGIQAAQDNDHDADARDVGEGVVAKQPIYISDFALI